MILFIFLFLSTYLLILLNAIKKLYSLISNEINEYKPMDPIF